MQKFQLLYLPKGGVMYKSYGPTGLFALLALAAPCHSALSLQVSTSVVSPQPLGSRITITASATNSNPGPVTYRFENTGPGGAFTVQRDFSVSNTFDWVPALVEGNYTLRVTARDYSSGESAQQTVPFSITSLVTGNLPVITATAHPLVALFSIPPCTAGSSVRVRFQKSGANRSNYTNFRPCRPGSINFYIAGMNAGSTYQMNYEKFTAGVITPDTNVLTFQTGALPGGLPIPGRSIILPPTPQSSQTENIVLWGFPNPGLAAATDLSGRIAWYLTRTPTQLVRPLSGGSLLLFGSGYGAGTSPYGPNNVRQQMLWEVDLAGNVLRETNADRISEHLMAVGADPIGRFNHDAIRMDNGNLVLLADAQRTYPAGTQGSPAPVSIIGAVIVMVNPNFEVLWHWNSFDHAAGAPELDINREAIRKEVCTVGTGGQTQVGCPGVLLNGATSARDWLHANSLFLAPDGNLLLSLRNQDWVIKIHFANGAGSGNVLWRLGLGGDFTMNSPDPNPWFSAQHEAAFELGGQQYLSLFDNGNTRVNQFGGNSRGQVLIINEAARTASLDVNIDLGVFAGSQGSAQLLANGNFLFHAGAVGSGSSNVAQALEVTATGTPAYIQQGQSTCYRSWRLRDFYAPPRN
jgi:hypothetical protein